MRFLKVLPLFFLLLLGCKGEEGTEGTVNVGFTDDASTKQGTVLKLSIEGIYLSEDGTNWVTVWEGSKEISLDVGSATEVYISEEGIDVKTGTYLYLKIDLGGITLSLPTGELELPETDIELTLSISTGVEVNPGESVNLLVDMNSEKWLDVEGGNITGDIQNSITVSVVNP